MSIDAKKISKFLNVTLVIVLFLIIFLGPYQAVSKAPSGRDYASYHYAVQAAAIDRNPYDVSVLDELATQEGTRKRVHPFFYPPPALLSVLWVQPFSLRVGYGIFFWFNLLCLFGTLWQLHRWKGVSWTVLLSVSCLLYPIMDTMKMGQLNLFVGLMMTLAVRHTSGIALGMAAMTKMSPALLFFGWSIDGRRKAITTCVITCFALSFSVSPWISISDQWHFYTKVLPEFSSGAYHGLTVPINIPANHSIPDLFNQWMPSATQTMLSDSASKWSKVFVLLLLSLQLYLFRFVSNQESKLFVSVSLIPLMLITPVYCYEHHLAMLLLPVVLCMQAIRHYSLRVQVFAWGALLFGGQPLFTLRWLQRTLGYGKWWFQESKFAFIVAVGLFCIFHAIQVDRKTNQESLASN